MKRKDYYANKIKDKVSQEIRNAMIITSWDMLTLLTKMSYAEKIQYLIDEYHLSDKRIEQLIGEARDTEA